MTEHATTESEMKLAGTEAKPAEGKMEAEPVQREMEPEPFESGPAEPIEPEPGTESINPSLRELCERRRQELRQALDRLDDDGSPQTRRDIEAALDALDPLLTGDLDQIPPVVAAQLSRWLESSKYLGAKEARELAAELPGVSG